MALEGKRKPRRDAVVEVERVDYPEARENLKRLIVLAAERGVKSRANVMLTRPRLEIEVPEEGHG
ncbi:MAG: hypothetical protein ACOC5M_01250 [Chloroflexota bacterium]